VSNSPVVQSFVRPIMSPTRSNREAPCSDRGTASMWKLPAAGLPLKIEESQLTVIDRVPVAVFAGGGAWRFRGVSVT
jgi:hypothetical protein